MNPFIEHIHACPQMGEGMDLIIISCSTKAVADFWESHLNAQKGILTKSTATIIAVVEDWEGGAGNGFGTLYALKKAKQRLGSLHGTIALYHTAGKGTRLSPLTLAESNNKPAVKLPAILKNDINERPLSILEMVILQTAPLACRLKDRIAVFWSDQIFIPSIELKAPTTDIEIFAKKIPFPDVAQWHEHRLDTYGLVTLAGQHLNKLNWNTFNTILPHLDMSEGLGVSLGSFSLSLSMLEQLLEYFADALDQKSGKLDTDTHLWMPATLSEELRSLLNCEKPILFITPQHYSVCDVGEKAMWWDFGTLSNYYTNCMKLLNDGEESDAMRSLFGIKQKENITIGSSCVSSTIKNSILMHVCVENVKMENVISIESNFKNIEVERSIFYRVNTENSGNLSKGIVRADILDPDSQITSVGVPLSLNPY